jgi:type IV pilus assembly protein PilW
MSQRKRNVAAQSAMPIDQRGFTLIELMVALVVSSVLTLAVFAALSVFEGRKRTTTATNDASQAGNYAMYTLDKWVRSAGSGFAQSGVPTPATSVYAGAVTSFGCQLFAARGNNDVLPRGASNPLPAPFANVNTGQAGTFRLVPLMIAPGQTTPNVSGQPSDVLIVMAGAAGFGEGPILSQTAIDGSGTPFVTPVGGASQLNLNSGVSLGGDDLVLLADQPGASNVNPCMVQQINSVAGGSVLLTNGTGYGKSTIGSGASSASVATYSANAVAMKLGNVAAGNAPSFTVIGVGDDNTLFSYDLLQTSGADATPNPNLQALAEGVFELHALYGIDTDNDGRVDSWQDPGASGSAYSPAALTAGTNAAAAVIARIKAVRVGLILRTSLQEKEQVAPATLSLFSDLGAGLTYTRTLNAATGERNFRYRVAESTIPLRNSLLLE